MVYARGTISSLQQLKFAKGLKMKMENLALFLVGYGYIKLNRPFLNTTFSDLAVHVRSQGLIVVSSGL